MEWKQKQEVLFFFIFFYKKVVFTTQNYHFFGVASKELTPLKVNVNILSYSKYFVDWEFQHFCQKIGDWGWLTFQLTPRYLASPSLNQMIEQWPGSIRTKEVWHRTSMEFSYLYALHI